MFVFQHLKDFPQKWDLADPLPEGKPTNFIKLGYKADYNLSISFEGQPKIILLY